MTQSNVDLRPFLCCAQIRLHLPPLSRQRTFSVLLPGGILRGMLFTVSGGVLQITYSGNIPLLMELRILELADKTERA